MVEKFIPARTPTVTSWATAGNALARKEMITGTAACRHLFRPDPR
jgi:hypothetical protein